MSTDVIDLSHYQPTPDWDELIASDVVGVILKCTEGSNYVDPTFRARYDAALEAGLYVSTYHFLRPGSIQTQLSKYLATLDPRDGERVCLDHEDPGVSLDDLRNAVAYLQSDSRNLQVTIYSGHLIEEQLGMSKYDPILASTSLWTAQYCTPSQLTWPTGTWPTWTLWQYTDAGVIPGVDGAVDFNEFNGTKENCAKWLGLAGAVIPEPTPAPAPEPAEEIISINIVTKSDVQVELMVNGVLVATSITGGVG